MIPKDPVMLLSYVNLKLRDYYANLQSMCDDLGMEEQEIIDALAVINYRYDRKRNQFI